MAGGFFILIRLAFNDLKIIWPLLHGGSLGMATLRFPTEGFCSYTRPCGPREGEIAFMEVTETDRCVSRDCEFM